MGEHQISNTACAVAAVRNLKKFKIKEDHIIKGINSVKNSKGRLEIINNGFLKKLAPSNTIICDVAHNPSASFALNKYLKSLNNNKKIYVICGMMKNKIHEEFFSNFQKISEIIAIDIPNNNNCIKKENLKKIIEKVGIKTETSNSIESAIKYIAHKDRHSTILIVGSIYLIGEVLKLN